jgi:hypothetical protein
LEQYQANHKAEFPRRLANKGVQAQDAEIQNVNSDQLTEKNF